jgi:NAD+ synthase (glutamine-hydrolysing)
VLATSNKSELAMGLGTLYGDLAGSLAPLGDLYKTEVKELASWINDHWGKPILGRTFKRSPNPEPFSGQKTIASVPPYAQLDPILRDYFEKNLTIQSVARKYGKTWPHGPKGWVQETIRRAERNEFKRVLSSTLPLKVSGKAFGSGGGRRVPIARTPERR